MANPLVTLSNKAVEEAKVALASRSTITRSQIMRTCTLANELALDILKTLKKDKETTPADKAATLSSVAASVGKISKAVDDLSGLPPINVGEMKQEQHHYHGMDPDEAFNKFRSIKAKLADEGVVEVKPEDEC